MKRGRSCLPAFLIATLIQLTAATGALAQTNPTVVTLQATNVVAIEGLASGTLQGTVNPGGTNTTAWFEWGVRLNYGNTTPSFDAGNGTNPILTTATLSNLNAGWRYHYRLVASNRLGVARGANRVCWAPAIALNGSNPLTNECHTRYMEPARVKATPVAIAAGGDYNLALRPDGSAIAWGDNQQDTSTFWPSSIPSSASNIIGVAACRTHGLAVRNDGKVFGWGTNLGQLNIPSTLTNVVAVAVSAFSTQYGQSSGVSMALTADGTVVKWPVLPFNPTNVATNAVAIAAGSVQWRWLYADGTVGPNAPSGLTNVVAIACGSYHTLSLRADGTVVGWGDDNSYGQTNVPPAATNIVAIGAGEWHSLAIRDDGSVIGWGRNDFGQINIPADVTNAIAVAGGYAHSVALLADGRIICWGDNSHGQTKTPADFMAIAIAAGGFRGFAVTTNGDVVNWGMKRFPNPGTPLVITPAGASNIVAVAAGQDHSLALRRDGRVFAWGSNNSGQTNVPAYITNVTAIAACGARNFAVRADGSAFGWGASTFTASASNIVRIAQGEPDSIWVTSDGITGGNIPSATNAVAVAAGYHDRLVLRADGTVLGSGLLSVPASATNVVAIATGGRSSPSPLLSYALAARADGTVIAWGTNASDQLAVPARVKGVIAVSANVCPLTNANYSLALRDDGTVIGWGDNSYGQTMIPSSPSTLQMNVEVTGSVNTNIPGSYALTYSATNAEGAISTASHTVVIADTRPPSVTLLGANPLMLEVGRPFLDAGASASDLCAGDLTSSINTTGGVNTNVPGTYLVNYSVTDASGFTGSTNRTVVIVTRPALVVPAQAGDGSFQFTFTNTPGAQFNVLTATNVSLPLNQWTLLGPVTEASPGELHFTDATATNRPTSFYQLRWP